MFGIAQVDAQLFINWFASFIENIPPVRPVLLLQGEHSAHMFIEVIEMDRANYMNLLCLPGDTSPILQPLDVGAF